MRCIPVPRPATFLVRQYTMPRSLAPCCSYKNKYINSRTYWCSTRTVRTYSRGTITQIKSEEEPERNTTVAAADDVSIATSKSRRRNLLNTMTLMFIANQQLVLDVNGSYALGFKKDMKRARRNSGVSMEDYQDLTIEYAETTTVDPDMPKTLKYYDLVNPSTSEDMRVHKGDSVLVHFDCIYKKIDAVSTRSARLLGENRVIAEPFQFIAGSELNNSSTNNGAMVEGGGGLFSGQKGPKPPQALSYAVIGMARGGKRSVLVPASLGYRDKGEQEIPPNCDMFELIIEVL